MLLVIDADKFNRLVHHIKEVRALTAVIQEELDEIVDEGQTQKEEVCKVS